MAGLRVIRGPCWNQGDADGGEGHVGTVTSISPSDGSVTIVWDGGQMVSVQQDAVRVLDSGTVGISHENVVCDACRESGIMGMRWKCAECDDFDLCSLCYFSDCHDRTHHFYRIETSGSTLQKVEKRSKSLKIRVMGIYPEATVMRGLNWEGDDKDGGPGAAGHVTEVLASSSESVRSVVEVQWENGTKSKHRIGFMGMVDLKYTEEAPGGECYPQHLPVLDAKIYSQLEPSSVGLSKGDSVVLYLSKADLQKFGQLCGGIVHYNGKAGIIQEFADTGEPIVEFGPKKFKISNNFLKKVPDITVGDRVRVDSDEERVKLLQEGHGEYSDDMRLSLGRVGEVLKVDSEGDIVVQFAGCQKWLYNPACLSLALNTPVDDLAAMVHSSEKLQHESPQNDSDSFALGLLEQFMAAFATAAASQARHEVDSRLFLEAVINNNVDGVSLLLQRDRNLVKLQINGIGILLIAANKGFLQMTKLLVENGAEINKTDEDGHTALLAGMKHEAVAEYLINQGCDIKVGNKHKRTPAHEAATFGHAHILRLLQDRGADLSATDDSGDMPLHNAVIAGRASAAEVLIGLPHVNLRHKNVKGFSPLHLAAYRDEASIAGMLLKKDQTLVDEQKEDGFTALHVAALNNHINVMKILLEQGKATVDCREHQKQTPLHLAAGKAHMDALQILIQHGADVNAKDSKGNRPLHTVLAVEQMQETELVLLFLGVLPRDRTERQVRFACRLLQAGADPTATNDASKTPLEVSRNEAVTAAVKQFLAANPSLWKPQKPLSTAKGNIGSTPNLTASSHITSTGISANAAGTSSISRSQTPASGSSTTSLASQVPAGSTRNLSKNQTPGSSTSLASQAPAGSNASLLSQVPAGSTRSLSKSQTPGSSTSLASQATAGSATCLTRNSVTTRTPSLNKSPSDGSSAPLSGNQQIKASSREDSVNGLGNRGSASLLTKSSVNSSTPNLTYDPNPSSMPTTSRTGWSAVDNANSLPGQCQVCRLHASTILMVPCGHRSACRTCCIKSTLRTCPECGAAVKSKFDHDGKQVKNKCVVM